MLYFQIYGVKVSKAKVERLSDGERLSGESFYYWRPQGYLKKNVAGKSSSNYLERSDLWRLKLRPSSSMLLNR